MTDSPKRIKPASVLAFLFMPQFRLSFQQFSFIMPVFIRTIAVMFVQAGLLPHNHPATQYGAEGVRKYGFFELVGEAWYTLRANGATPYQWALFSSVVLMVVFIILSLATALLNLSGMLMSTAHAQIFDSPLGATDMDSVPAAASGVTFDRGIPNIGTTAHADYGIMILDKLLRQGAMMRGGPLQNALGSLMQIYNTGMLAIAGIMLFWSVLSVVTDTAKTGQIGGGRHNMVWAPIRIVFGLGLLIPLGASGFSSGQFMVMKLAEWGSNWGTRGWVQYVSNVVADQSMLVPGRARDAHHMTEEYVKMWVCRVAYNGYERQTVASPDPRQIVRQQNSNNPEGPGTGSFSFKNDTPSGLCGMVTYPTADDPELRASVNSTDAFDKANGIYKRDMRAAYAKLFIDTSGNPDSGTAVPTAKKLACAFVSQHLYGSGSVPSPLTTECGGAGGGQCGAGPAGIGPPPDASCVQTLANQFYDAIEAANQTAFGSLRAYTTSPAFMREVAGRGWAGMGVWYHRIAEMNHTAATVSADSPVRIVGGGGPQGAAGQAGVVGEILGRYSAWWQALPSTIPDAAPRVGTTTPSGPATASPVALVKKGVDSLMGSVTVEWEMHGIIPVPTPHVDFDAIKTGVIDLVTAPLALLVYTSVDTTLYPLAMLSNIGQQMLDHAIAMYTIIGITPALIGFLPFVGAGGAALAAGPLVQGLLSGLAGAMMVPGLILVYWVPLIPLMKVSMAVLAWMVAVFEAVVMVPVAALTHISTEGEGMGGQVRNVWIMWMNVLLRPILTVIGYVGAMLVFNVFVNYFTEIYASGSHYANNTNSGIGGLVASVAKVVIYVSVVYAAANSIFKMVDMIPHAVTKYMGGHADTSFDDGGAGAISGMGHAASGAAGNASSGAAGAGAKFHKDKKDKKDEKDRAHGEALEMNKSHGGGPGASGTP